MRIILKNKTFPADNFMLKINNGNTKTRCKICSKLTIKTPEILHCRRSGVLIVNFENISHLVLVLPYPENQVEREQIRNVPV